MSSVALVCSSCGNENPDEARFCLACGAALEQVAEPKESRKHVTLVFSDVVGSTALAERTDPETVRRVMSRYFDAMRAVRAAAGIADRLRELNEEFQERYGVELAIRTGVNSGEVIAGDASQGQAFVTGDAVNVAARLEQAA